MDGEFNEENVAAFVDAYVKGSLKVRSCCARRALNVPMGLVESVLWVFVEKCQRGRRLLVLFGLKRFSRQCSWLLFNLCACGCERDATECTCEEILLHQT